MRIRFFATLFCMALITAGVFVMPSPAVADSSRHEHTLDLYDRNRDRGVPLAFYHPADGGENKGVVFLSHGYGRNRDDSYLVYSYLSRALATEGYAVISIQHERPDDEPLAMEGDLFKNRLSNWERGVDTIRFTLETLKTLYPGLCWADVTLIGHSNGGDMTMLFAERHPALVTRAISLDHRRMPMPRAATPRLYSLRGYDYEADPGVLPTENERADHAITIVTFSDIAHEDMDDKGTPDQHEKIIRHILAFMKE